MSDEHNRLESGKPTAPPSSGHTRPNVVYVFADQWRLQSLGYAGNPDVKTPNIDRLATESVNLTHAVAGSAVCCPSRASLLTGQYPLTHGVFVNDVRLGNKAIGLGRAFREAGYDTAYIGKWHVDGRGRSAYIPPDDRQGFDYWKALECTHDYNHSYYYAGDSEEKLLWEGYDAQAQTRDAQTYIRNHSAANPFLLVLSWGPPHAPYRTAPPEYQDLYQPQTIQLRPNVPESSADEAKAWLAGYYAHCTALDDCLGELWQTLKETGHEENTIFVFTSDHGDMLGSHGMDKKQKPWEESIRIPFLLHYPAMFDYAAQSFDARIDIPDIMPTLLGLCNLPIPDSVEGLNYSNYLQGGADPSDGAALLACYHPFGQWLPADGGREYRGLRTRRYTYVRALDGPWLLYDNETDPYQLSNLAHRSEYAELRDTLDARLQAKLDEQGDAFLSGLAYIEQWGYPVDETGTVPWVW